MTIESQEHSDARELGALSCDLSALSEAQRRRRNELAHFVIISHTGLRELGDGYAFEIPGNAEAFLKISEWIILERACCPFFLFSLQIDGGNTPIRVSLTGPSGTKEILKAALDSETSRQVDAHPSD